MQPIRPLIQCVSKHNIHWMNYLQLGSLQLLLISSNDNLYSFVTDGRLEQVLLSCKVKELKILLLHLRFFFIRFGFHLSSYDNDESISNGNGEGGEATTDDGATSLTCIFLGVATNLASGIMIFSSRMRNFAMV